MQEFIVVWVKLGKLQNSLAEAMVCENRGKERKWMLGSSGTYMVHGIYHNGEKSDINLSQLETSEQIGS